MLVSDSRRFIFVHVQRTGGISMEQLLKRHVPDVRQIHGRHGHARDAIADLGERWHEYFTFAFVRNPWDRLVSWHSLIRREYSRLSWIRRRFSQAPFKYGNWNQALPYVNDFEGFIRHCTPVVWDQGCRKSFAFSQVDYLADDAGDVVVDYVGRFERLNEDVTAILNRIGLDGLRLPHVNAAHHEHYSRYFTPETRDIVGERFRRDIEAFGYQFEASL